MKFIIPTEPRPLERPRFSRKSKTTYTPTESVKAKEFVMYYAKTAMRGHTLFQWPITINLVFHMPIPVSLAKKVHEGDPCSKKPDIDNLVKLVLDACNGVVYSDDNIVSSLTATKLYSHEPRTEITISTYGENNGQL